jgi:hypothetical protein
MVCRGRWAEAGVGFVRVSVAVDLVSSFSDSFLRQRVSR